ncbi:acyltransferase family protein [Pseudomonas typographi]|uniref:acyltransferase family protein n=1 Tax=Pseudomonas typographi TaxID=2715964 RepID=UPI001686DAC0|nr:acyltransferase [Pseudomonas typographi]MBD1586307.1 acyltransferase [Pseudomonas typographi]
MLISIQALRALAAWMVVCHHFMQIFFDFHAEGPIGHFFSSRGAAGVDIFFVISGLVIYLSTHSKPQTPQRFLLNRLLRIVPAYWFYTVLTGLLLVSAGAYLPHPEVTWATFVQSLLFIPTENPGGYGLYPTLNVGWTLNYEVFFYLVFSLMFLAPRRLRPMLVAVVLFVIVEGATRFGWASRFYANTLVYEFLLGIAIGVAWRRGWIRAGLWWPLALVGMGAVAIYWLEPNDRLMDWGLPSALIVLGCVALEPYFKGARVLKALGDRSYSVYLVHLLVLYAGRCIVQQWGANAYGVFFGFCVPLIAVVSSLSYALLEKRLYRWAKAWAPRTRAQPVALPLTRQNW